MTFIGPTQRGKTTLALDLLKQCISKEHHALILAGKPPHRDHKMAEAAKALNLEITETYPPSPYHQWRGRNKNGWVLRPHQTLSDLEGDQAELARQFHNGLVANYASKKPVITVVDEAHHVQNDLGLKKEYESPLMRGAPHNAVWSLIQRGRFMSYLAYDAPEHLFLFFDPDKKNQQRYSEIGGVDPDLIQRVTEQLKTKTVKGGQTISEALYIRRSGPRMAIVDFK